MSFSNKHFRNMLKITAVIIASYLTVFYAPSEALAISGNDWNAGNIISDEQFYNNSAMTVSEIQSFMETKVPSCDTNGVRPASEYGRPDLTHAQYAALKGWSGPPYICLSDYYQVPRNDQVISNLVTNIIPTGAISAAQIIKNAADTYGINPAALIVILQKESPGPLVTDTWPLPGQYRNAMGYGCPDTAPCDPTFEGFYNQMMNAAKQFKRYKDNPSGYNHVPFQNNEVLYSPSAGCGSSIVYIQNFATAGLYNYTPYQPNQAALNNLYGTGDGCSAYGNRNFWRIYNDWFLLRSLIDSSVSVTSPLKVNGELSYVPRVGQWINYSFSLKNTTQGKVVLNGIKIGCTIDNNINNRCDSQSQNVSLDIGEEKELVFSVRIEKLGNYYSWICLFSSEGWFMPSNLLIMKKEIVFSPRLPDIEVSTFSVNNTTVIGEQSSPVLAVKNNGFVDIDTDAIGVGGKINTSPVRAYDYAFSDITLGARSDSPVNINISPKYLSYVGSYTFYPVMRIGNMWFRIPNASAALPETTISMREANIKATWFLVPSLAKIGQSIKPELKLQNFEKVKIHLDAVGVAAWLNYPAPNARDFNFKTIEIDPGSVISVDIEAKIFSETGVFRTWPIYRVGNSWFAPPHVSGWPPVTMLNISEPNIKITWFLVPTVVKTGTVVAPELKVQNFENVDITVNNIGIAAWLNYPNPNLRDFQFQTNVKLTKNAITTIPIQGKTFSDLGIYRVWAIYNVGKNWFAPMHVSGWPAAATMKVGN